MAAFFTGLLVGFAIPVLAILCVVRLTDDVDEWGRE